MYVEVHTDACRERTRAHGRRYREQLHGRYDHVNTVIIPAVEIIFEDVPAEDEPDLSTVESERPVAIPSPAVSLAMARVFSTGERPSPFDWALVCSWWLRRQHGLLTDSDQD